ncbi:MAG TPA: hypothetical protein VEN82_06285 [Actinomycetota bacterium]|nr:hypothetical protein [Actinomycetota bacterium]
MRRTFVAALVPLVVAFFGGGPAAPAFAACGFSIVPNEPVPNHDSDFSSVVATSATEAWAFGDYDRRDGGNSLLAERWDGTAWTRTPIPDAGPRQNFINGSTALSANDIWVVGDWNDTIYHGLIEHWDGTSWTVGSDGETADHFLQGVSADSPSDVWAVGGEVGLPSGGALILHFDGTSWSPSSAAFATQSVLNSVVALAPDDVWAVGSTHFRHLEHTLVEHWNGSAWSVVPSPTPKTTGGDLWSAAATGPDDVWAVGEKFDHSGLSEHWDGTSWSIVSTPTTASVPHLHSVVALSPTDVVAVGYVYGPDYTPLTERWDGSKWRVIPSETQGIFVFLYGAAAIPGTSQVWAVGNQEATGQPSQPSVERSC